MNCVLCSNKGKIIATMGYEPFKRWVYYCNWHFVISRFASGRPGIAIKPLNSLLA